MSELLRTGRMNELGRFEDGLDRITLDQQHNIFFLESDVNELAQAKGANVAGLQTVFSNFGIHFDDIDVFYLAGGFGRHLKIDAARRIGLIPEPARLKNRPGRQRRHRRRLHRPAFANRNAKNSKNSSRRVEHCRLETHPQFFDFFVEGCQFKPLTM